jgi:hypothetical protein
MREGNGVRAGIRCRQRSSVPRPNDQAGSFLRSPDRFEHPVDPASMGAHGPISCPASPATNAR